MGKRLRPLRRPMQTMDSENARIYRIRRGNARGIITNPLLFSLTNENIPTMQSYTVIQTPQAGVLTLVVPRELDGKRLLVTITENTSEHEPPTNPNAQLLSILLSAPTLSEEDTQGFTEARTHLNQWRSV